MDQSIEKEIINQLESYPNVLKYFNKNDEKTKQKIIKLLLTKPSDSDGLGFVYGYKRPSDINLRNNFYMKLGRTIKSPVERIGQWHGDEIFSSRTIYNKKLERFIHLIFNYVHEIRRSLDNQHDEIEWFHFREKTNVQSVVSELNEIILDLFDKNDNLQNKKEQMIVIKPKIVNSNDSVDLEKSKNKLININTCTINELLQLPKIGKVIAQNIISARPYSQVDELLLVSNIGQKIYQLIKNQIDVD
jgi:DNA uptake protein ComE-like DNA-binding protein